MVVAAYSVVGAVIRACEFRAVFAFESYVTDAFASFNVTFSMRAAISAVWYGTIFAFPTFFALTSGLFAFSVARAEIGAEEDIAGLAGVGEYTLAFSIEASAVAIAVILAFLHAAVFAEPAWVALTFAFDAFSVVAA